MIPPLLAFLSPMEQPLLSSEGQNTAAREWEVEKWLQKEQEKLVLAE